MSLLNKASLIQIPSGYKDGTLYSAKPTNGDGDFTFSRGSNLAATRVNSEGLIEKGRENLLVQSNSFDTTWTTGSTLTSGQSGYDGSSDAWSMTEGNIKQNITNTGVQTFSIYAKANTLDWIFMDFVGVASEGAYFDVANGNVGTVGSGSIDAQIESVGSGWYRCSIVISTSSATAVRFYTASADEDVSGSGSIYIQDAQLEVGLIATDYIETTTTTAQAGILEDMPRLDYSGGASCGHLLLEPQRTNLLENSEYFDGSGWNKTSGGTGSTPITTINTNETLSPEGVYNATKIVFDSGSGTTTGDLSLIEGVVSIAANTDASTSIWLKGENGGEQLHMRGVSNGSFSIITLTTEWQQFTTSENSSTTTDSLQFGIRQNVGGLGVINSNATIYAYGAQIEEGSYPTSYIPTYGAGGSVTRSADSCYKTGISSLIGGTSGTVFFDITTNPVLTSASYKQFFYYTDSSANQGYMYLNSGNVIVTNPPFGNLSSSITLTANTRYKIALTYANNDFAIYVNGTSVATASSGTSWDFENLLSLGSYTGVSEFNEFKFNQYTHFKTRLTNDELASLTTI
jgi:hypothetical protein